MRTIVSKLPYKVRERRRTCAYEIEEAKGKRAKFADLAKFVDRQAKVAMDPLFGDLVDTASAKRKEKTKIELLQHTRTYTKKRSNFVTSASTQRSDQSNVPKVRGVITSYNNAFTKPCLLCEKDHTLEECQKMKEKTHKERIELMDKGYAVKVTEEELMQKKGKLWYIPHHGVYHRPKKKLRVVFDCAASFQGVSLNTELLQSPDFANSLVGVLMRFRQEPVAFMADIEAMYYQVKIPEEDTDFLQFLCWPNGERIQNGRIQNDCVFVWGYAIPQLCEFCIKIDSRRQQEQLVATNSEYCPQQLKQLPTV